MPTSVGCRVEAGGSGTAPPPRVLRTDPAAAVIVQGVPAARQAAAVRLYDAAFAGKLRGALPRQHARRRVLRAMLVPSRALAALDGDRLIGIAGLAADDPAPDGGPGGAFTGGLTLRTLVHELGLPAALRAAAVLAVLEQRPDPGWLTLEAMAVDPSMRGRGVGRALLDAVKAHAVAAGFAGVRLEVVDENPGARRLYEREGFVAGRRWGLPGGRHWLGFAGSTVMRWPVPGAAASIRSGSRC